MITSINFRSLLFLSGLLPVTLQAGLVAHWKLDSSPAEETAEFPAFWNGTAAYSTSVAAPKSSGCANLAGTWLAAGTAINFERTQPFSASAWIRGAGQDAAIIGDITDGEGARGWELHVGSNENGATGSSVTVLLVSDYPAVGIQVNASANVLNGQWHHITFTYDGSSSAAGVKIYIDGAQVSASASFDTLGSTIANNDSASLNIGTRMNGNVHTFQGFIDEVGIFDHTLTSTETTSIFANGIESVGFPVVKATVPTAGQSIASWTTVEVKFSSPVSGVDAGDLQANGVASSSVVTVDPKNYRFTFLSPPPQGDVHFTWSAGHGISGVNGTPAQPSGWSVSFVPVLPAGQVVISEFLTKNAGGREDEDHDTPDWIELHNPGTATVDLAGWSLTDEPLNPRAWVLPSVCLAPRARLVVFASGKNRSLPNGTLHTTFKLADDGGYLALSNPSGTVVHAYDTYPRQEANVSFGLADAGSPSDGRSAWRYMIPTPAAVNNGTPYSGAAIISMDFSPAIPQAGQAVTVTIRTAPGAGAIAPKLHYKRMYETDIQIPFSDDGLHGDGAAGDLLWGAVIPAGANAGEMIRWRASLDWNGTTSRWPVNETTASPLPLYEGIVIGGNPGGHALPIYQFFVPDYAFPTSITQTGIDSTEGARGAFYGNGKLYDNVLVRIKGTTSLYLFKRSHRVDFNPGRDFEWSPDFPAQRELNLNSEYNDPSYLRQNQQLWMHRDSGNAGAPHFPVKLLMNGATWQLAFHTYSVDSELIEVLGLDPRGALYKQVRTLETGAPAEKKSRRWESQADYTAFQNGITGYQSLAQRSRYIHDNVNLPAVINYIAVARIAQEADDVWANMVIYRDSETTKEWRPIPFDLNLSFGQLFYGGDWDNTTVHADHDRNKGHPLYGSSACQPTLYQGFGWNRLYDAIIQNPVTRAMLLRRIRTLTDRYLTQSATGSPLENNFNTLGALIGPDAVVDRAHWGLPPSSGFVAYGLGPGISPSQGLTTLKSDFLAPRRTHFYVTHSVLNTMKPIGISNYDNAGIPKAQIPSPTVTFGTVLAHPSNGNQNEEYIQLTNPSSDAVDISDWTVSGGGGSFKMKGGTVIAPLGSLYISPNVVAFRGRSSSPKANEERFVVGPYSGHLSPYGETLRLFDATQTQVAQVQITADPTAAAPSLAVTEIMSSSSHTANTINGDWWELTNTGSTSLDLAGFSWDDNHAVAGQAVFPAVSISAGESIIVLNEDDQDEAAAFRSVWNLPSSVRILTREEFGLEDLAGLGGADSIVVYKPDGTQMTRMDYTSHSSGKSRAWFKNGILIPNAYSQPTKYGATRTNQSPADSGSPGFAAADPATLTGPYAIWASANDLWESPADALAAPGADADNDGRSNRTEYIFGGSPRAVDGPPAQTMILAGGSFEWTFTRRAGDPSVSFSFQSSTDLIHWSPLALTPIREIPHPTLAGYVQTTCVIAPGSGKLLLRVKGN